MRWTIRDTRNYTHAERCEAAIKTWFESRDLLVGAGTLYHMIGLGLAGYATVIRLLAYDTKGFGHVLQENGIWRRFTETEAFALTSIANRYQIKDTRDRKRYTTRLTYIASIS